MRSGKGFALAMLAALSLSCGGDNTSGPSDGGKPTRPPGGILLNDTLTRTIASALLSDTLKFTAVAGQRIHIDLQQVDAGFSVQALTYALVSAATGGTIESGFSKLPSVALGPDVADRSLTWRRLQSAGTYLLITTSKSSTVSSPFFGAYRVRLVGSNPAPEHAAVRLVTGDSLTESIDIPGDVDEFTLVAPKGTTQYAFVKANTGNASDTLIVEEVVDQFSNTFAASPGNDAKLDGTQLIPLGMSADSLRIRVRAISGATVGKYQLKLYQFNKNPEGISSTLALGDTIKSTIEYPGDVDEFTFVGAPGQWYGVAAQATSGRAQDRLHFEVTRSGVVPPMDAFIKGDTPTLLAQMSTRFLGGAEVTVRVSGAQDGVSRGTYRLVVIPISGQPETGSASIAIGDTISGAIDTPADFDEYTLQANKGDLLVVYLQAGGTDSSGYVRLTADSLGFETYEQPYVVAYDPRQVLRQRTTTRAVVPATGSYKVRVEGFGGYRASYRFVVVKIATQPEVATNSTLTLNVPTFETGDPPGDVDRFYFNGVAGQEVVAYLQLLPDTPGAAVDATALFVFWWGVGGFPFLGDAGTDSLAGRGTGLMTLPFTGVYPIDVAVRSASGRAAPYKVTVYQLNKLPELVPRDIKIGDRVTDEPLWPSADVDDFRLTGTAGTKYKACLKVRSGTASPDDPMWLWLTDTPGVNIVWARSGDTQPACTTIATIPAGGQATVRVYGAAPTDGSSYRSAGGPYTLEIIAVP